MQESDNWTAGQHVSLRGRRWRIEESTRFADCRTLRLTPVDHNASSIRTFLLPFDRPHPLPSRSTIREIKLMRPQRWLRTVHEAALNIRPFGGLSGVLASRIDLLPYQLEPALAMLGHGSARVMIADAVGLGKTIQAGVIIQELSVERESFRALVVTPAGLRDQWASELATRFSISVETVTSAWLTRAVREVPPDVGPWTLPGVYLCSFEYIRRPEVLRPLEDVGWDLLVVDEAHAATPGSARRTAVHAVALRSRRVVLLTATPHGGSDEHFRSLCQVGCSDESPDPLVIFCRSRADVGRPARRRTVLLPIRLSELERRMHRLLERYTASVWAESRRTGNGQARLAAIVLRKRALSSARSLAMSCNRRLTLLRASPDVHHAEQLSLPLDEDAPEDDEPDLVLGARGLADAGLEQHWLETIIAAATEAARRESKIVLLKRLLRRMTEPLIVFTEFRDTLQWLQTALVATGREICTLHGAMTTWERSAAQERFNRGDALLLATDAAAEGLNLHSRCRIVLHFELPWSPSRLEQRTGRVDRIGQSGIVHEIMLVAADTAERLVLAPLAKRTVRARRSVAGRFSLLETLSESRVASAIMDGTPLESSVAAFDVGTSPPPEGIRDEARREAARLGDLREWATGTFNRRAGSGRVAATLLRAKQRRVPAGLIRIYILALTGRDGEIVHSELVAVHERRHLRKPIALARIRDLSTVAAADTAALARSVLKLLRDHIDRLVLSCTRATAALSARERVASLPITSAAERLVQRGLFDGRAGRAAHERDRAGAAILEEREQRIDALNARTSLTPSITLTALIFVEDRGRR
jgi:superfamily II DNA or RNA helicase